MQIKTPSKNKDEFEGKLWKWNKEGATNTYKEDIVNIYKENATDANKEDGVEEGYIDIHDESLDAEDIIDYQASLREIAVGLGIIEKPYSK